MERDQRIADLMQERDAWRRMAERLQPEPPRQLPEGLTARHRLWAWFWGKRIPAE